jgi:hypothetical protein
VEATSSQLRLTGTPDLVKQVSCNPHGHNTDLMEFTTSKYMFTGIHNTHNLLCSGKGAWPTLSWEYILYVSPYSLNFEKQRIKKRFNKCSQFLAASQANKTSTE